jgi:hypothetical protein
MDTLNNNLLTFMATLVIRVKLTAIDNKNGRCNLIIVDKNVPYFFLRFTYCINKENKYVKLLIFKMY